MDHLEIYQDKEKASKLNAFGSGNQDTQLLGICEMSLNAKRSIFGSKISAISF